MPIGIIVNFLGIVLGGIIGTNIGKYMSRNFVEKMNLIFGLCAFSMAISNMVLMQYMPAVVLATILGSMIGLIIHLSDKVNKGGRFLQKIISKVFKVNTNLSREEFESTLMTCIAVFIFSGSGIYGAIISGITGDHSMLLAKTVLDTFTAVIFACNLGYVTSAVAVPQFIFLYILFLLGGPIYNALDLGTNTYLINDFKACGGLLIFGSGLRMTKLKMIPVVDMVPALILVFPISMFWHEAVVPFVAMLATLF